MSRTCIWERERDVPGGTNSLSNNWHIVGISGSIQGMGGGGRRNGSMGGGEEASTMGSSLFIRRASKTHPVEMGLGEG